jgi:hypothetical protein
VRAAAKESSHCWNESKRTRGCEGGLSHGTLHSGDRRFAASRRPVPSRQLGATLGLLLVSRIGKCRSAYCGGQQ